MAEVNYEPLRRFLNRECVWQVNPASSNYYKVFSATTAVSPDYRPRGRNRRECHYLNVTLILVKPKGANAYIVVYVNDDLVGSGIPEALFFRKVAGGSGLHVIYVGPLAPLPEGSKIPANIALKTPILGKTFSMGDIWGTSTKIDLRKDRKLLRSKPCVSIAKCSWYLQNSFIQYYLAMHCAMLCPGFRELPSLARMLSLLTRCDDASCVPCYGAHIHVEAAAGYTEEGSNGCSSACPCVLSCAALRGDYAPITGNESLLSLIFDAQQARRVVGLRFYAPDQPVPITAVFCGVMDDGSEATCNPNMWELLRLSDFVTRCTVYGCQILKRQVLHSC